MRRFLLLLAGLYTFNQALAQTRLESFVNCAIKSDWQKQGGMLCGFKPVQNGYFFNALCNPCFTFGADAYLVSDGGEIQPPGQPKSDYDYNVFVSVQAASYFDPLTDQEHSNMDPRTIFMLFSSREAYDKELKIIKENCTFNSVDGSYRERTLKYVAIPIELANNARTPRLLRGFRFHLEEFRWGGGY